LAKLRVKSHSDRCPCARSITPEHKESFAREWSRGRGLRDAACPISTG
jgi:hypothetical protein